MKLLLLLCVFSFIVTACSSVYSQTDMGEVEKIISKVEIIQNDTDLKTVTLRNEEFLENMTDGGGELTAFYKGNEIFRVVQNVGISYGVYLTEYFYEGSKLIFVGEKFDQYEYDSLHSFDYSKTTTTFSGIYYFNDGKLIYSTSSGHNRFEGDDTDPLKYYTEESNRNIALLRKKIGS